MTHDEMIFCIQKIYPGTTHGIDYWVAHPVDDDMKQSGPAFIVQWKHEKASPMEADIQAQWDAHGAEYQATTAAAAARTKRNELLSVADHLIEIAKDRGDADREAKLRAYRGALRDVPNQQGFPLEIIWPPQPA